MSFHSPSWTIGDERERAGDDRDRDRENRARYPEHFYRWRLALWTLVLQAALTFTPAK